jgi:hypothetical protein
MSSAPDRKLNIVSTRQIIAAVICISAVAFAAYQFMGTTRSSEVHYPYWCQACKAVFDVSELKKDYPKNWRVPPGAASDSVVLCLRCNEGWAFPAPMCGTCGDHFLLHIWPNAECPACHPEIQKAASARDINLAPPELKRSTSRTR